MSLKKTFSSDGKKCTVVFTVNPEAAAGATKIFLAGDFNSWDPTSIPMKKDPNGSFSVKKQLETNKEFQFRYCIDGNTWINDWKADKYVRSEFASDDNSVVDTTVPKAAKVSKKPTSKAVNKTADKKPAAKVIMIQSFPRLGADFLSGTSAYSSIWKTGCSLAIETFKDSY